MVIETINVFLQCAKTRYLESRSVPVYISNRPAARRSLYLQQFAGETGSSAGYAVKVQSYRFGNIVINGKSYENDVIIFPDRVRPEWWRQQGHSVCEKDIEEIVDYEPDMVIFGTGATGRMEVPQEIIDGLEQKGITVKKDITSKAQEKFNKQIDKGTRVVGAFHLTC